ncbi:hypothetical protein MKW94_005343 [Papaver nudicaule]|uniref:Uncharacterized protein n=1 Tax=Papaver nudicaule TaxID=74823 RepID=A0AA41W008_PAPNU|nr:hypothetical protein [Papaver nudicaule]
MAIRQPREINRRFLQENPDGRVNIQGTFYSAGRFWHENQDRRVRANLLSALGEPGRNGEYLRATQMLAEYITDDEQDPYNNMLEDETPSSCVIQ